MNKKLNQVLAETENGANTVKQALTSYIGFFKNSQGAFVGERTTVEPIPGASVQPTTKENNKQVVTTVNEKLEWLNPQLLHYLKSSLDMERTNASGTIKANLIVEGEDWGEYSSLELLRLKSFVTNAKLKDMITNIPVRSDAVDFTPTDLEQYKEREISQTETRDFNDTTTKVEQYIIKNPDIGKGDGYNPDPVIGTRKEQEILAKCTYTKFSGEWTQRERATSLRKLQLLRDAIIDALQRANANEVIESAFDGEKLLQYILK